MLKIAVRDWLVRRRSAAATSRLQPGPGWTQQGEARSFEADNLFEYMDGNAKGYVLYGFQSMHGVTCVKDGVTLVIDISDFGDADSAYGMFSANRDLRRQPAKLGMGGQIVPRRAIFTKGAYYVEIAAKPEGDHSAILRDVDCGLGEDCARQHRCSGGAFVVPLRWAAVTAPGAGKRTGYTHTEAWLCGAVRFRQGIRSHRGFARGCVRGAAEVARAVRRDCQGASSRRCIPGDRQIPGKGMHRPQGTLPCRLRQSGRRTRRGEVGHTPGRAPAPRVRQASLPVFPAKFFHSLAYVRFPHPASAPRQC